MIVKYTKINLEKEIIKDVSSYDFIDREKIVLHFSNSMQPDIIITLDDCLMIKIEQQ